MLRVLLFVLVSSLAAARVFAHGGGLDQNGGHHDHKTGTYHCHQSWCKADKPHPTGQRAYSRKLFPHWIDEDRDCQNARIEVLVRDAKQKRNEACRSVEGVWIDVYTGRTLTDTSKIDIDHIVPLKEAWDSGARNWSDSKLRTFANDLDNLVPVSRSINRTKGAKDPARWMPSRNKCWYIQTWQAVKAKYGLSADAVEIRAATTILSECFTTPENDAS